MTPPPQDPRRPLLQTVCRAGLLTLAALMADQAHQLPRLGPHACPAPHLRQPSVRVTHHHLDDAAGDATEQQEPEVEVETQDVPRIRLQPDEEELPDEGEALPALELPCAPIYSFDEEGDILQCVEAATLGGKEEHLASPAVTPSFRTPNDKAECPATPYSTPDVECSQTALTEAWTHAPTQDTEMDTTQKAVKEAPDATNATNATNAPYPPHTDTPQDTHQPAAVIVPKVTVVSNPLTVTPKIKLHAGSVEVEDDYLESHLDEDQRLRDLCATFLGECDWQNTRPQSTQNQVVGLLSVNPPQDPASRRSPRVPFDAVVFTERKPSTGDALVLSLGLSADGANTIQDIASRNQGAARERLQQQGEVVPSETRLTRQCESCGVSPEECLKKLGLHSDISKPVASPKSERLLHFFRHLPADMHARGSPGAAPLAGQEFEHGLTSPKQKSRSLSSSPTNVEDDGRKSRLVAL